MTSVVRRLVEGLLTVLLLGAWAWVAFTASDATQRDAAAPAEGAAPVLAWRAMTESVEHAVAVVVRREHEGSAFVAGEP